MTFYDNLRKYARILVEIGVNITEGDVLQFQPPVTDDPDIRRLAHYVVEMAYKAGAKYVNVSWTDAVADKQRLLYAAEDTLE